MTTDMAPAPRILHFTRAALYLLEGCLQDMEACTTPAKMAKWGKLWEYVRKGNDRTIPVSWGKNGKIDIEAQTVQRDGETQQAFQQRVLEHNEAFAVWQMSPVDIELNGKRYAIACEAVKFAIEKKKLPMRNSAGGDTNHTLVLLTQLELAEDDE